MQSVLWRQGHGISCGPGLVTGLRLPNLATLSLRVCHSVARFCATGEEQCLAGSAPAVPGMRGRSSSGAKSPQLCLRGAASRDCGVLLGLPLSEFAGVSGSPQGVRLHAYMYVSGIKDLFSLDVSWPPGVQWPLEGPAGPPAAWWTPR